MGSCCNCVTFGNANINQFHKNVVSSMNGDSSEARAECIIQGQQNVGASSSAVVSSK